jgi:hypothetical protein
MTKKTEKKPLTCSICQGDIDVGPSGWAGGHNAEQIKMDAAPTQPQTSLRVAQGYLWPLVGSLFGIWGSFAMLQWLIRGTL